MRMRRGARCNLLDVQLASYDAFLNNVSPKSEESRACMDLHAGVSDRGCASGTSSNCLYSVGHPRYSIECKGRDMTFAAPLKATLRHLEADTSGNKKVKDVLEQDVFLANCR
jgi:DNA-directed RNA polymerase beta subunit